MFTPSQQAEIAYKKILGKASTGSNKAPFEESLSSPLSIHPNQIWFDASYIPTTAPVLAAGTSYSVTTSAGTVLPILTYYENLLFTDVVNSGISFYSQQLVDAIPYDYDPAGSYRYIIKDANNNALAFGLNNWIVDPAAGTLTFYDGLPNITLPLTISFYKYVGRKSFSGLLTTDGTTQMATGYVPTNPLDVMTKQAFDTGVSFLDKLLPPAPPNLSSISLQAVNTYSAYIAGTNTLQTPCVSSSTPTINTSAAFFNGDSGVLTAYVDTTSVGTQALSTSNDVGVYSALRILTDTDPYEGIDGKAGLYKQLTASIVPTSSLSTGVHTTTLSHSLTGTTPIYTFYVDDPATTTVSNVLISAPATTTRYISGVPSLSTTDTFSISFSVNNAVRTHYAEIGAMVTSAQLEDISLSTPGTPNNGAVVSYSTSITPSANTYAESVTVSIVGRNSANISGTPYSTNILTRIDTVSNEARFRSGIGLTPTIFGAAYDSSIDISDISENEELQLLNRVYRWPTGNYATNTPTAGPDYSSVSTPSSGYRWATFQPITLSNSNGFTVSVIGAQNWVALDDMSTSNVKIYARIRQANGTPTTMWVDCNSPYSGVGSPGSGTTQGDAAMLAGSSSTTATSKKVTFGTKIYSGLLYIRIGLTNSSQRFSSITVNSN